MKLNMSSPLVRLSVELTPEQVATLVKAAVDMAAGEETQNEDADENVVEGFVSREPDPDDETEDADEPESDGVPEPPPPQSSCMQSSWSDSGNRGGGVKPEPPAEVPESEPAAEEPKKFSGFLHLRCRHCSSVKSFCAKAPIDSFQCNYGHRTELRGLRKIQFNCECGKFFRYQTNLEDDVITMDCFTCGSPVDLEWNRKKQAYEKMK